MNGNIRNAAPADKSGEATTRQAIRAKIATLPRGNSLELSAEFDEKNPEVWTLFEQFTWLAIRAGRTRFSATTVLHRIRWETMVGTTDDPLKINNNHSPYYARKFMSRHPEHAGFFELREVKP